MRLIEIIILFAVLIAVAAAGMWGWSSRREQLRTDCGLRAAELGAKLAFAENVHREKFGAYTRDFSRLGAMLGEALPCPLEEAHTVLACPDYRYRVQGTTLVARWQQDPAVYIAFGLEDGSVDCSHALADLQQEPICSAWE